MDKAPVLQQIRQVGVIAILRTPTAADALAIAEVLAGAKLTALEIPLTVPGAIDAIRELVARLAPGVLVGAGTVLDAKSADACIKAGATFIISPSVEVETIAFCRNAGVAVFPGALTPTEVVAAWRAGADMVKIFPCSALGGAAYIKALRAPLPQIEMVPTGGVSLQTAASFIEAGASALGVGGDLIDISALKDGRVQVIADRALAYAKIVKDTRAKLARQM
jgi:2-dehydro-3-deoxyphosphogluconate aldolase/(4S)-4-hydroxy-2-oxoglutarate aldolase